MKSRPAPLSVAIAILCFLSFVAGRAAPSPGQLPDGLYAEISTPRGVITCELFFQRAPLTVASFVGLAEGTLGPAPRKPFFDGLKFHRVVPDFVVQGGDPLGTGEGGPGYDFPDEFGSGLHHDSPGVLSMANSGPDTNGSQFFLTLRDTNRLNYLHPVFGHTVGGLDLLAQIKPNDPMTVKIVRVGAAARAIRSDDAAFAALLAKTKKYSGLAEPGPAAHCDDPNGLLPLEPPRAKAFNFKLANFERAASVKLVLRLHAKSPPVPAGGSFDHYVNDLAIQLGVEKKGALVLYVADRDEWNLRIGDEATAAFLGGSSAMKNSASDSALREAVQTFLQAARATGDADFARQQKSAAADKPLPPGQRLKLQADALLDGLILKFEPKPQP